MLKRAMRERGNMEFKTINPLWSLSDSLSVQEAAALIADFDPNAVRFGSNGPEWFESQSGWTDSSDISWVKTAFAVLTNAIQAGKLKVRLVHDSRPVDEDDRQNLIDVTESGEYFSPVYEHVSETDETYNNGYFVKHSPDWSKTMIDVGELRCWLESKGLRTGFFFPTATDAPDYLNPSNPRYAPKLAAAVRAWQAVTDPKGKSPKQALDKWLREHAADFGLTDDDGNPVNKAVEDCSVIANWQPGGGAAKTPG